MIIMFIILALLIILCAIRMINNDDLIVNNCKSETDLANINNAKKVFRKAKTYNYLLLAIYASIVILLICAFTDIDYHVINFISLDIVTPEDVEFNINYCFLPIYIYIVREILIQVKIGEFLLKYFKTDEPVLEENILKSLLYKKTSNPLKSFSFKKAQTKPEQTSQNKQQN